MPGQFVESVCGTGCRKHNKRWNSPSLLFLQVNGYIIPFFSSDSLGVDPALNPISFFRTFAPSYPN